MLVWYLIISCISFTVGDTFMFEGLNYTLLDNNNNLGVTGYNGSPTVIILQKSFILSNT